MVYFRLKVTPQPETTTLSIFAAVYQGAGNEKRGNPFPQDQPSWLQIFALGGRSICRSQKHNHRRSVWQRNILKKFIINGCLSETALPNLSGDAKNKLSARLEGETSVVSSIASAILFRGILHGVFGKLGQNSLAQVDPQRVTKGQ